MGQAAAAAEAGLEGYEDSLRLREVAAVRWRQANQEEEDLGSSSCAGGSQGRAEAPAHQRLQRPPIVSRPDSLGGDGDGVTGTGLGGERRSPAAGILGRVPALFTSGLKQALRAAEARRLRRPPATANSHKPTATNQRPNDQTARVKNSQVLRDYGIRKGPWGRQTTRKPT